MSVHARDVARAVVELSSDVPSEQHGALIDAALSFLERHRLSGALRSLPRLVRAALREHRGVVLATVRTPSGNLGEGASALLSTLEHALGTTVDLEEQPAPELLGGAVLAVGDERLDGSIRGALEHMTSHLMTPSL